MAMLPQLAFPRNMESEVFESANSANEKRQIQLDTSVTSEATEGCRLAVPHQRHPRPANLGTVSTPPDSPTLLRAVALGSQAPDTMHGSGAFTPPATPTTSHSNRGSAASDFLASLSSLRCGDSMSSSSTGRPSLDELTRPGGTDVLTFPYYLTDYIIKVDGEGRTRPIGVGAWSDVYLASPNSPHSQHVPPVTLGITPPLTPVMNSRSSSRNVCYLPSSPDVYAIKVPGSISAKTVLNAEARILSYLSRFPGADDHIVSFFGQDARTGALVLRAMDGTLEDWIGKSLNTLDASSRAAKLAALFPTIALSLIDSLIWMQDKDCIHADIKPSNILFSSSSSSSSSAAAVSPAPALVYSDFSSTILTTTFSHDDDDMTTPPPPMGAGTWEFLDPCLLTHVNAATPCPATDLWSLAITLLFLVLGTSPYDAFKANKFQLREIIKSGDPLQCLAYHDQGMVNIRRLQGLSKALGWDVSKWFAKVLVKSKEERESVSAWREELLQHMGS
ncbi:hypothetical protein ACEQ8H_000486 [Pleosporales sp. CAS-2024a]